MMWIDFINSALCLEPQGLWRLYKNTQNAIIWLFRFNV